MEQTCSVCSIANASPTIYVDADACYPVCSDCLTAIDSRSTNPAKWNAFVLKYGDGRQWFEQLPLPSRALNKLQCK